MKRGTITRLLVALTLIALALFVLLTLRDASRLDLFVTQTVARWRSPLLNTAFAYVTQLGSVLVVLIWSVLALRHNPSMGKRMAIATISAWLAVEVLKTFVSRPRPIEILPLVGASGYSFPSTHAGVAAATYGTLAALIYRNPTDRLQRVCAIAGSQVVVGLVALSRIYLGVHYLTDVLAGALVGAAIAAFAGSVTRPVEGPTSSHRAE